MSFGEEQVYSALRWNSLSTVLRFVLNLIQVVVLANALGPNEFALVSVAMVIIMVSTPLLDFGTSASIIHFQDTSITEKSNLFWFNLFCGISLAFILILTHPLINYFFQSIKIPISMFLFIGLYFPTFSIGQFYLSFLEKDLNFNRIALIELLSTLFGLLTVIAYLYAYNKDATAFSVGLFLRSLVRTLLLVSLQKNNKIRIISPRNLSSLKRFLNYGKNNTLSNVLSSFISNADLLIGGRFLTSIEFSLYSLPRDIALKISNGIINPIINKVSLPMLARDQFSTKKAKDHYLFTILLTCSLSYPIYGLMITVAPFLIDTILNEKWASATNYFQLLCIWGLLRAAFNPVGMLALGLGKPELMLSFNLKLFLPAIFVLILFSTEGTKGLIIGNIILAISQVFFSWKTVVSKLINCKLVELLEVTFRPLACVCISLGMCFISIYNNFISFGNVLNLVIYSLIFTFFYLLCCFLFNQQFSTILLEVVKVRNKKAID